MMIAVTGCGLGPARSGKSYVINGKRYYILASADGFKEKGNASWYGEPFHGRKTASGEVYDMNRISAAHKTLPLHTWVEVRNLDNNKTMALRINDRGPFVDGRIIDLSRAAAQQLGMYNSGVARVHIKAITGARAKKLAEAAKNSTQVAVAPAPAQVKPIKVASSQAPAAAKTPVVTTPAPSAGDSQNYGVQAFASSSSADAEKHRKNLEKIFNSADILTKNNNGQTTFAVFVGTFKTKKEADEVRVALVNQGYGEARLIEVGR